MAGEANPQKDLKRDVPELQKPVEGPKTLTNPEQGVHATARAEWQGLLTDVESGRRQKITDRKQQIDDEQKKLETESSGKRNKESWVANPDKNSESGDIGSEVESGLNEPEVKDILEKSGLTDDANRNALKTCLTGILTDYLHKIDIHFSFGEKDRVKGILKDYAKNTLLPKVQYLFGELNKIYESKKHSDGSPIELIEGFSNFTKTDFIKKGYLQPTQLKDFLLLEKSDYETFIGNFGKSLGLVIEKKQLEGEELTLTGGKIEPKEQLEQKKITLTKISIIAPKDLKDLDKTLQDQIPNALPPIDNAVTKQKFVDYLIAELKKLNPQPDDTFELSPEGQWKKVDTVAETQSKNDAKKEAETQTEAVTTATEATNKPTKPFSLAGALKAIMDVIKEIFSMFGLKIGPTGINDLVKAWKDITPEETKQLEGFYGQMKNYFSNVGNVELLIKDPEQARRMLAAKKADTKENETWPAWIERHVSQTERDTINFSRSMDAKAVADAFISGNGPGDTPVKSAETKPGITGKEDPQKHDTPLERAQFIAGELENAGYSGELKNILDSYVDKNGRPEIKEALKKAKNKGAVNMNAYFEVLSENFLRNSPEILKKVKNNEMNNVELMEVIFDDIFRFASAEAKSPAEKQKIDTILSQFKATLDKIVKERGKPDGIDATKTRPQGSGSPDAAISSASLAARPEITTTPKPTGGGTKDPDLMDKKDADIFVEAKPIPFSKEDGSITKEYLLQTPEDAKALTDEMNALKNKPNWHNSFLYLGLLEGSRIKEIYQDPKNKLDPEVKQFIGRIIEFLGQATDKLKVMLERLNLTTKNNGIGKILSEIKQKPNWKQYVDEQLKSSKEFRVQCLFLSLTTFFKKFAKDNKNVEAILKNEFAEIEKQIGDNQDVIDYLQVSKPTSQIGEKETMNDILEVSGLKELITKLNKEYPDLDLSFFN